LPGHYSSPWWRHSPAGRWPSPRLHWVGWQALWQIPYSEAHFKRSAGATYAPCLPSVSYILAAGRRGPRADSRDSTTIWSTPSARESARW